MPTKREQLEEAVKTMERISKSLLVEGAELTEADEKTFNEADAVASKLTAELIKDAERAGTLSDAQALLKKLGANGVTDEVSGGEPEGYRSKPGAKTLGETFVTSPEWQGFLKQYASGTGFVPDSVKFGNSLPVQVKSLLTGASATSAGALVWSDRTGLVDPGTFQRPLTVKDVITVGSTDSDTVDYARMTGFTNAAAMVAEATATAGASGLKPESDMTLAKVTAVVKTVAHWLATTKRALSDASQIRTLIDNFLIYGLEEKIEQQIIAGDGTGENFQGITTLSGIQTHAKGADSLLDAYRKAKTKVELGGRALPNAYLMHPNDWQEVDLLQNNNGNYYFGGPARVGTPVLWGLPVVTSEALTEGTAFVGDFRTLILWNREGASIQASDNVSDQFIRNMVTILAEMRAAFGALRPAAIVKITGI